MTDAPTFAEADPQVGARGRLNPVAVPTPGIVAWIDAKATTEIDNWNEIGPEEYARAFTAARTAGYDVVRDLYDGFRAALAANQGEVEFAKAVTPILRAKGWMADADDAQLARRLAVIFDTNLRISRAVGQWQRVQATKAALPYLFYSATLDSRVRPSHAAMHGTIAPVDHPIWNRWYPPCGYRCRCVVRQMTRSQALRAGGVTDEAELDRRLREHQPDAGWDFNPGVEDERAALRKVAEVNTERLPGAPWLMLEDATRDGALAWNKSLRGA